MWHHDNDRLLCLVPNFCLFLVSVLLIQIYISEDNRGSFQNFKLLAIIRFNKTENISLNMHFVHNGNGT